MSNIFALITETKLVSPADLHRLCEPLEQNAAHCAKSWNKVAPAVVVMDRADKIPLGCYPVVFTDNEGDAGSLAVHYWDPVRQAPAARVYVDKASGLKNGRTSVIEAAAHEICEAIADADCSLWTDFHDPGRTGIEVALENCDPVQDTYNVPAHGELWPVANFVTPAWFNSALVDPSVASQFLQSGQLFDYAGRLAAPFSVGPEGYLILRERDKDGWWRVFYRAQNGNPPTFDMRTEKAKTHPMARSRRRLTSR